MKRWVRRRTSSAVPSISSGSMMAVAADLVAEPRPDPSGVADDHGRPVLDGQQGDRLVGRGGAAEEVDVQAVLAGVLVGEEREDAALAEDVEHLVVSPVLGISFWPVRSRKERR